MAIDHRPVVVHSSNVAHLPIHQPTKRPYSRSDVPGSIKELNTDARLKSTVIEQLEAAGLDRDARGIWMGYPNLANATESLVDWVGLDWPSLEVRDGSAVTLAVCEAIRCVKKCIEEGVQDRRLITASYYRGLDDIARNLSCVAANAFVENKLVGVWQPMTVPFSAWITDCGIDRVVFARRSTVNDMETVGMRWIVRTRIASAADVGLMDRNLAF